MIALITLRTEFVIVSKMLKVLNKTKNLDRSSFRTPNLGKRSNPS